MAESPVRGLTRRLQQISLQPQKIPACLWKTSCIPSRLHQTAHGNRRPEYNGQYRSFTSTSRSCDWLTPKRPEKSKSRVGRPHMPTGGSVRGTTVVWGDYGLRMKDHDRRVSAKQLKIGEETIRRRLRGTRYTLYKRVSANIGVYTKGNEVRMGKGKGKFDYWAARVAVSRILFEVSGDLHEKVVRDAFRLAGHKLPGLYEFVKKGDPPVVGITKLGNGVTLESLKEARRPVDSPDAKSGAIVSSLVDTPPQTMSTSTAV